MFDIWGLRYQVKDVERSIEFYAKTKSFKAGRFRQVEVWFVTWFRLPTIICIQLEVV